MDNRDIGRYVGILNNKIKRYFEAEGGPQRKLTGMQGRILFHILQQSKLHDIYPKDIEIEFSIRRATVSRFLIALENSGMIERLDTVEDGRMKKIVVTDNAKTIHANISADIQRLEDKLSKNLSQAEITEYLRITKLIIKNMDE